MGLAASQARLLTITSRISNNELKQQRIAMDKMRLASDQDSVSTKYSEALNNKTLSFINGANSIPMTYEELLSRGYSVARASDGVVAKDGASVNAENNSAKSSSVDISSASSDFAAQLRQSPNFLIQGLLSGYLVLMKDGQQVSMTSATDIEESYDKSDDAAAESEYNSEMAKINRKEKLLDMQAKRLDTEYSSLTTELESIKSIISSHASKDFSYFSG